MDISKPNKFLDTYGNAIGAFFILAVIIGVIIGCVFGIREGFANESVDVLIINFIKNQNEASYADYAKFLYSLGPKALATIDPKYTDLDYYNVMYNSR